MTKQINQRRQPFLLAAIAAVIMLGASGSVFAQDKYPKPDFSAMEEYWEVVEWEYDFTSSPTFIVIAKPKQKAVPRYWDITWRDAKGVALIAHTIIFNSVAISQAKIGDPVRGSANAPTKALMQKVKSVKVTENPEGGDGKTAN